MAIIKGTNQSDILNGTNVTDIIYGYAGNDTLNGGDGNDTLIGGAGIDIMNGGLGNDIYSADNVDDIITENLNGGIDKINSSVTYMLSDNVENLTLTGTLNINATGNGAANIIIGNSGSNRLTGGAGNDTLNGKEGNNILTGGTGMDYFQFKTADHIETGHIDTITDFNVVDDTIKLDKTVFTVFTNPIPSAIATSQFVIGSKALDADDFIIYDNTTGKLLYDPDGSGSDAAIQFATITAGLPMDNKDFHVI